MNLALSPGLITVGATELLHLPLCSSTTAAGRSRRSSRFLRSASSSGESTRGVALAGGGGHPLAGRVPAAPASPPSSSRLGA